MQYIEMQASLLSGLEKRAQDCTAPLKCRLFGLKAVAKTIAS